MKERSILFNTEMVKAILEGRKTQTRRVVTPLPIQYRDSWSWRGGSKLLRAGYGADYIHTYLRPNGNFEDILEEFCPYGQAFDRLWVREAFILVQDEWFLPRKKHIQIVYKTDGGASLWGEEYKWKSPILMPRQFSRLTLEITNIKVERLQSITEEDAKAEGCSPMARNNLDGADYGYRDSFLEKGVGLWDSINGKKHPWDSNPWVWAIEFKRFKRV